MTGISWLLALLVFTSALWVVTLRNLFRAALSLGLVLLGIAGCFLLLEAEFLAFVQILVYVGAILTLVIFVIMLTVKRQGSADASASRQPFPAAVVSAALFLLLTSATGPLLRQNPALPSQRVSTAAIGQELVTTLVLPFEVISLVFVAAIVGAILLATPSAQKSSGQ